MNRRQRKKHKKQEIQKFLKGIKKFAKKLKWEEIELPKGDGFTDDAKAIQNLIDMSHNTKNNYLSAWFELGESIKNGTAKWTVKYE